MTSPSWPPPWTPSWASARRCARGSASTCAPTPALAAVAARPEMLERDHTPQVRPRGVGRQRRVAGKRARRWVVEVAHSWFTRFRKLLVRYEKLHSHRALSMLAAAIITLRRIPAKINIIYG
jgi:transposase